ncbi:hypothetical protein BZA77DRAFT_352153 [Pyronema omphalodes]|nr:hypothetical protein BZA77DRAFT_352153 [Pyronema omphalodes]
MVFQRRLTTEERLRLREHEARVAANAKRSLSTADLSTIDGNSEPNSKRAQTDRPELRFSEPQIPVTTSLTSAYQPYEPYRRISEEDYYASFDFTFDEIDADNAPPVTVAPSAPTPVVRNSSLPAQPSGNTTTPDQRKYPIAPSKSESNSGLSKVTPNRAANNVVNGQTIPRSVNGPSKLSRVSYAGREHPKETPVSQLEKYGLLPKTSQGPSTAANSPAKQTPVAAPKATTPTKPNPQSFPQRPRVSYVGRPLPRLEDTPKSQLALLTEAELQALKQAEIASTLVPPVIPSQQS